MKLKFLKLELHVKLKFQNNGILQNISKTVVDCQIFRQTMIFGHFGRRV